jgi:hypothetical protein
MPNVDMQLGWCAGLFDGEGCIGMLREAHRHRISLRIAMVHGEALHRFAKIMGAGIVRSSPARGHRLPYWVWRCQRLPDAQRVLTQIYPLLSVKKAEAEIALWYLNLQTPNAMDNSALFDGLRSHKSKPGPWGLVA